MGELKEYGVVGAIVIAASLLFDYHSVSGGAGKFLAYFTTAAVPAYFLMRRHLRKGETANPGQFIVALIGSAILALFVPTIILVVLGRL